MQQVFAIHKIVTAIDTNNKICFHGRALTLLKLNQVVYLNDAPNSSGIIANITSYGRSLDEIEPVMGCSLTIEFKENILIPENTEWLFG